MMVPAAWLLVLPGLLLLYVATRWLNQKLHR